MARYRRLIVACMLLPFILVALSSSDDEEKDEKPRAHTVVADLLHPDATLRDYRGASETQQESFVDYFTRFPFGKPAPVAMGELPTRASTTHRNHRSCCLRTPFQSILSGRSGPRGLAAAITK